MTLFEIGVTVISAQSFATIEKIFAILSRLQSAGLRDTRWISGPKLDIQIVLQQFISANDRLFYCVKLQVFHLSQLKTYSRTRLIRHRLIRQFA